MRYNETDLTSEDYYPLCKDFVKFICEPFIPDIYTAQYPDKKRYENTIYFYFNTYRQKDIPQTKSERQIAIKKLCKSLDKLKIKYIHRERSNAALGNFGEVIFTMNTEVLDKIGSLI